MMPQRQLYLLDASTTQSVTTVLTARQIPGGQSIALQENSFRPAGGGEPADRGGVRLGDGPLTIVDRVEKLDGLTWLVLPNTNVEIRDGAKVAVELDPTFREGKRRLHTLMHMALALALRHLTGFVVERAEIAPDLDDALVVGHSTAPVTAAHFAAVDREVRSISLQSRPVTIDKAKSIEEARERFGPLFRLSERHQLSGKVRLVCIRDLDVNPCNGTHFDTTSVGPFEMTRLTEGYSANQLAIRLRLTSCWTYWYGPD